MEINNIISTLSISYLFDKDIKLLLIDVDGTLITNKSTRVSQGVEDWISRAKKQLHLHLLSNNPSKERIRTIAQQLKLEYTYSATKPSRKSLVKVISKNNYERKNVAIVGDRIFTDILAGKRLGIYTILVRPIRDNQNTSKSYKMQEFEKAIANFIGGK